MKKVRIFFAAAGLLLVTAGVFAGKSKFLTPATNLYYQVNATTYGLISSSIGGTNNLEFGLGGTQVQFNPEITGFAVNYPVVYWDGAHYQPVYHN